MTRPLRVEYEGAWYHVMNRGANKQNIFLTDEHRSIFLTLLGEISKRFYIEIHAYCLMSNHYHLLIQTPIPNLSKAMRHLDSLYTLKFNRLEKRDGPLFRGRYKSILIEKENYLLQVSRYIHLNPVSANLCLLPEDYKWSSYTYYLQEQSCNKWLHTKFIFNLMNSQNFKQSYTQYVKDGLDDFIEKFYKKEILLPIMGSKQFNEDILKKITEEKRTAHSTEINKIENLPDLEIIANSVCEYFKVKKQHIINKIRGKKNVEKLIAIYISIQLGQIKHEEVAKFYGNLSRKSISNLFKRGENLAQKNIEFKNHLNKLFLTIKNKLSDG